MVSATPLSNSATRPRRVGISQTTLILSPAALFWHSLRDALPFDKAAASTDVGKPATSNSAVWQQMIILARLSAHRTKLSRNRDTAALFCGRSEASMYHKKFVATFPAELIPPSGPLGWFRGHGIKNFDAIGTRLFSKKTVSLLSIDMLLAACLSFLFKI